MSAAEDYCSMGSNAVYFGRNIPSV